MTKEEAIRILNLKEDYNLDICEYQYIANEIDKFGRYCKFDLEKSSIFFCRLRRAIMKELI